LKLLLNKSQAQIQALVASRRVAAAANAASAAAGGGMAAAPAPVVTVPLALPKAGGVEDTKYYVDVDPNVTQGAFAGRDVGGDDGGRVPQAGTALEMMIQRPPIAPGTVAESGSWAPNKKSADYALMFQNASIAMAVASLDGNFVDCNGAFSIISGYNNREVLQRSVFDLTPAEDCQELMSIVGKMMESPAESAKHFWKRCCFENRDCHCFVSMWLVRKASGEPVYFQCAVLPLEDYPMSSKSVTYDASSQGKELAERGEGEDGGTVHAIEGQEEVQVSEANTLLQPEFRCGEGEGEAAIGRGGGGREGDLQFELPAPRSSQFTEKGLAVGASGECHDRPSPSSSS